MATSYVWNSFNRFSNLKKNIIKCQPILWNHILQRHISYGGRLQGDTVRIGCASGFWGDTMTSTPQLLHKGKIDYLVLDYLSEITMSLLAAMKRKDNAAGYTPDFVQTVISPHIKIIQKKGVKVIANAGGVNPTACALALKAICEQANVHLNIAVVSGDDLMDQAADLLNSGVTEMYSGITMPKTVTSINAYFGAGPIARALDLGADIVVTGRCVDSALVLGPLLHKFKWSFDDFERFSQASLAGHLIECGAQVTGGIFTDWHTVPDWSNIGFPIVECAADGSFVVTKPPGTGGLVSKGTVSEQLLYEIGDPACYELPDVNADFSQVTLEEVKGVQDAVFVTGAKGMPPSSKYKVSATYADGYRLTAVCFVRGPRSKLKAIRTAEEIIKRCRTIFTSLGLADFTKVNIEAIGSENNYGPLSALPQGTRECALWLAVHHQDQKALNIMAREIAPAGTGMAPGLTAIVGGRPKVSPVLKLFSFLHDKDTFKIDISMNGEHLETYTPAKTVSQSNKCSRPAQLIASISNACKGSHSYRLEDLAYTRSGDKGNNCNIGVVARHPAYLPYLKAALTEQSLAQYFSHLMEDTDWAKKVTRYDCPGIHALNFVLHNSLGGGGIASLRSDPQGKAYGQMLLDFQLHNMPSLEDLRT